MAMSSVLLESKAIGALTSKPYAFTARSWELRSINSVDISDGLFSRIRVDHRGGKVMRVLPRYSEEVNTEWISDKARHYLDGLQAKRIGVPIQNFSYNPKVTSYWSGALDGKPVYNFSSEAAKPLKLSLKLTWAEMANQIILYFLHKTKRGWGPKFLSGENTDNEGLLALKEFANSIGSSNYESRAAELPADNLEPYIVSDFGRLIDEMDVALFVGLNLRFESPVLNARVRRLLRSPRGSRTVVASVGGVHSNLTYDTINLGGMNQLVQLIEGQSTFCNILSRAKNPVILLSQSILKRADGQQIFQSLKNLSRFVPNLQVKILPAFSTTVGTQAINLGEGRGVDISSTLNLNYYIGFNPSHSKAHSKAGVSIYQGSHLDTDVLHRGLKEEQHEFDFLLPTLTSTEKDATYFSSLGEVENASFVAFPATGQMRTDWSIFQFLSLNFNYYKEVFEHFNKTALEQKKKEGRLVEPSQFDDASKYSCTEASHPQNDFIQPWSNTLGGEKKRKFYLRDRIGKEKLSTEFSKTLPAANGQVKLYNSGNLPLHKDFYLTDELSRASRLMTLCSASFSNLQKNFS